LRYSQLSRNSARAFSSYYKQLHSKRVGYKIADAREMFGSAPLRSLAVVPSVVSLHAIGQLLSPAGRCLSMVGRLSANSVQLTAPCVNYCLSPLWILATKTYHTSGYLYSCNIKKRRSTYICDQRSVGSGRGSRRYSLGIICFWQCAARTTLGFTPTVDLLSNTSYIVLQSRHR